MTVLKFKKHYSPRRYPKIGGRPVVKAAEQAPPPPQAAAPPPAMPDTSKMVFVGAIDLDQDEALAIALPVNGSIEDVRNAIERANAERVEKLARESAELRRVFLER